MGTRGYYCFRYKGLYYVIFNAWSSYPEGLGDKLVKQLQNLDTQDLRNLMDNITVVDLDVKIEDEQFPIFSSDIVEKFRKIILQDSSYFEPIKELYYSEFQTTTIDDTSKFNEWIDHTFNSQKEKWYFCHEILFAHQALQIDKALSFGFVPVAYAPDIHPPRNDLWIEWIYVIDLDNETFLARDATTTVVEFAYHNIPQNWMITFQ